MNCPCGTPGFRGRKDLAAHLNTAHFGGQAFPRARRVAQRLLAGETLAPEELVVIAPDRGERRHDPGPPPGPSKDITCPRCTARFATQGALEAHLMYEHVQTETQAHMEALAETTGEKRDQDGRCRACRRLEGEPHSPSCRYAQKLGLPTSLDVPAAPAVTAPVTPPVGGADEISTKESPMAKTPKDCKLCARKAPKKCKRHGGADAKATGGGKDRAKKKRRPSSPAAAAVGSPNGHEPSRATVAGARELLRLKLTEQRADLEAELRAVDRLLASVK